MQNDAQKKHDFPAREVLYNDAKSCDSEIFSEMRSNILLIAGEHYTKKQSSFFQRLRETKDLTDQQKIRLTNNHIQKIVKIYANNILSLAPGVGFSPKNESELQDQKAAELHHAVWQDAIEKYHLEDRYDDWCEDFLGIGEVHVKIFWDPMGGKLVGHRQKVDENGFLQFDEQGRPVPGEPVYEGSFVFETVHGFNMLRAPEARDFRESPYVIIEKMVQSAHLLARFPDAEKFIRKDMDETFMVFDGVQGNYRKADKETLVREFYFRPCPQYPNGYFFWDTKSGPLAEGELPGGIWPIVSQHCERIQTSARGRSIVKPMRPYQAEINRASSKMAEHQITLGDDKILIQKGTQLSQGAALPGIRAVNYTGMEPKILNGRDGSQYLNYMLAKTDEMYKVMSVFEASEDSASQMDPYTLLFRAASQKKKFQRYARRFERFLIDVARTYIKLAKIHLPDETVIYAVGAPERVNIPEFRNASDLCYQIKIDAQADDIETKMGKQLVLNHLIQYTGQKLEKEDIAKLVKLMPYANLGEGFDDLTLDFDSANNVILALDRGESPAIYPEDNHEYMIKRLTNRKRKADFPYLPEHVRAGYEQHIMEHQNQKVLQLERLKAMEDELIPTDGYLVVCDLYVSDPADPTKTRRARIPYGAMTWLIKRLEDQGKTLDQLEDLNQHNLSQIAVQLQRRKVGGGRQGSLAPPTAPT